CYLDFETIAMESYFYLMYSCIHRDLRSFPTRRSSDLEKEGHTILKLNTGNPAIFGFEAPYQIVRDMLRAVPTAHGYTDARGIVEDRKSTRLNSSHVKTSYAVFCLKKKKQKSIARSR